MESIEVDKLKPEALKAIMYPPDVLERVQAVLDKDIVVLRKHDKLVRMNNTLTQWQHKIYNVLLVKAQIILDYVDPETEYFGINISTLSKLTGLDLKQQPAYLDKSIKALQDAKIIAEKADDDYTKIPLLGVVKRDPDRIIYELNSIINMLLKEKSRFGRIITQEVKKMNNKYAIIMYEMCAAARHMETMTLTLDELQRILQYTHKEYYNVKRNVIEPAIREINEKTGIEVTYEAIKKQRKVKWIKIKHKRKIKDPALETDLKQKIYILRSLLEHFKVEYTEANINNIANKYKMENIVKAAKFYDNIEDKENIINPIAYLVNIIKKYETHGYYTPEEQEEKAEIEKIRLSQNQKEILESIGIEVKGMLNGGVKGQ